mmetsp:Transcript_17987/g.61286  ORF Transcript_17987/g.61286 Transcript_17987/m.61286 type:complete len:291 (+) Transcript_17987:390-1262(+)
MARKRRRSSAGVVGSTAMASTRQLNCSQLSSWLYTASLSTSSVSLRPSTLLCMPGSLHGGITQASRGSSGSATHVVGPTAVVGSAAIAADAGEGEAEAGAARRREKPWPFPRLRVFRAGVAASSSLAAAASSSSPPPSSSPPSPPAPASTPASRGAATARGTTPRVGAPSRSSSLARPDTHALGGSPSGGSSGASPPAAAPAAGWALVSADRTRRASSPRGGCALGPLREASCGCCTGAGGGGPAARRRTTPRRGCRGRAPPCGHATARAAIIAPPVITHSHLVLWVLRS